MSKVTSSCISGSVRVEKKIEKLELLCFSSDLLEIWYRGYVSAANYKKRT